MNIAQIEETISNLIKNINPASFIYDLLLAYGLPKASISRLQKGNLNLSKRSGEISWKKKVFFRVETGNDLHLTISGMIKEVKHEERFVIATDYKTILAIDTKTNDKLDIAITELHKHFDFFLPWAGMEKAQHQDENPADVKAAEKMAKLFDEIKRDNPDSSPEFVHNLNVFLSRLLFCYFAEDTNIFEQSQFVNSISSHTQADGSDTAEYFDKLFMVLNTPPKSRKDFPAYLDAFPYVNGGLFKLGIKAPVFTRRSRQAIIDCGDMDWSSINPDIFGSMMQAVVTPENRGGLGMHYTSVPNIMKVIKPLFLDDLYEEFEKAKGSLKRLNDLLTRIYKLKIFDPACGSGNFLIVTYKELRKLEMLIFKAGNMMPMSRISLLQFYGIEIDDFAHEIAQLSLWLAEHQMNIEFYKEFGETNPTLPLKEAGKIICGNACRIDWEEICPSDINSEIYILGNPPYLGQKKQSHFQKEDMRFLFDNKTNYKTLDYISCWFFKASNYIQAINGSFSFVSTNSICQGSHVSLLWPLLLNEGTNEIAFAIKDFKWENNAKFTAGVTCSIIGVRKSSEKPKCLYQNDHVEIVKHINPYLSAEKNVIVAKRSTPLSRLPIMVYGNMALDGGHLLLDLNSRNDIISKFNNAVKFIRETTGSKEFIQGLKRWCLWIEDCDLYEASKIEPIAQRIAKCHTFRVNGGEVARTLASRSHQFRYRHVPQNTQLIVPLISSERRPYLPVAFLNKDIVVQQTALVFYDPDPFIMGIICSRMHRQWIDAVGGKFETRISYSVSLCYNTFPLPDLTSKNKEEIERSVFRIIEEREKHSEKTLAELYDPDKMPDGLREAHHQNDLAVERCYRSKPFTSDEERLEHLFKLYEQMIEEEKSRGTLFEAEARPVKKGGKKKV